MQRRLARGSWAWLGLETGLAPCDTEVYGMSSPKGHWLPERDCSTEWEVKMKPSLLGTEHSRNRLLKVATATSSHLSA